MNFLESDKVVKGAIGVCLLALIFIIAQIIRAIFFNNG